MQHAPRRTGRVESEASVVARSLAYLEAQPDVYAMRNNVGAIKKGARYIKYGLGKGSADYVAIVAPHGRWLCLEFKRGDGGEQSEEQIAWIAKMRACGAVAGFCSSVEQVEALLSEARKAVAA